MSGQQTERLIAGASLTKVSQDTGLSIAYVYRLLRAKDRNPTLSNAAKVAKALGVSIDALNRHLESAAATIN